MTLVFLCPLCQLTVTVADSAAPAADRVGWALTKDVEVLLSFSGMYACKMLYGKKSLKGEASHIELFDAYGITPRKYEFPDGLDGVATLPFHEVTHDKKKYLFCAAANDTTNGIAVGLLYEIASGALVEKDLTTLTRGVASKDGKHVKAAAASLEVRSWGVCAWFAVRACSIFFFPFTPTLTALVLVETWCLEQESGGSRAARNAAKAQKQLAEKAAADVAAAAADAAAAAAAEKRQHQQTVAAAERKAAKELKDAEKAEKKKHGKRAAGKGKKRAASASSASEDDDDDDESNNDDEQPKDRRGRKRDKVDLPDGTWSFNKVGTCDVKCGRRLSSSVVVGRRRRRPAPRRNPKPGVLPRINI